MSGISTHIIHQQRILIRAADSRAGFDLQQAAGQAFWRRILPRLERLFDQYSSPGEVLRIERLEIDLGRCRPDELEEILEKRFLDAVALELQRLAARPAGENGVQRQSVPESRFGQWLFFLEHGSLPWSAVPGRQTPVFEEADLLETLNTTPFLMSSLQRLLGREAAARRRLVLQYKDAFLGALAARMADAPATVFSAAAGALAEYLPKLYASRPALFAARHAGLLQSPSLLRQLFWELVLQRIAKGEPAGGAAVFPVLLNGLLRAAVAGEMPALPPTLAPADWLRQWEMAAVAAATRLDSKQGEAPPENGSPKDEAAQAAPEAIAPKRNGIGKKPDDQPANDEGLAQARYSAIPTEPEATSPPRASTDTSTDEEFATPVDLGDALNALTEAPSLYPDAKTPAGAMHYLSDAGLVLLHPFFPALFQELGFTEGKAFKNFEAQVRAVHLLHFMAWDEEQPPEYQLLLPKLLCGLPLHTPIAQALTLEENERAEASALLDAAIRHWGALGHASPDGLREGFLQREGKLEKRPDGWRLIVERRTIDILLDRLPWGIGMVVLPWMKGEVVRVEWR